MNARTITAITIYALFLSGCAGPAKPVENAPAFDAVIRFKGALSCNDCSAISTDLSLYQDPLTGQPKGYILSETHIDAPGGEFTQSSWGEWFKDTQADPPIYHLVVKSFPSGMTTRDFELKDDVLSTLEVPKPEGAPARELRRVAPLAPVQ